jgi:hypothetical protein
MSQDSIKFTSSFNSDISVNDIPQIIIPNKKIVPFWSENPNVLFQHEYIMEFFPINTMTFSQSLNAVSRMIIILSFIVFIFTKNFSFLITTGITLFAIHFYYTTQMKEVEKSQMKHMDEGFANPGLAVINDPSYNRNKELGVVFDTTTSGNPFSNVLLPDYEYNINKKPAPPAYTSDINSSILAEAKKTVKELNPDQPDIADKLFKDLGEQLEFEQSMRNFYSTANTTIPNDQAAFAQFCYGSMISCKEGNLFACARNLDRYTN